MHEITRSGFVEVITGSMFSGKTEELLRRLRRARIAGQSVEVFTPAMDDRYGTRTIGSHAGREWEATVVDPTDPSEIRETVRETTDEATGDSPDTVVAVDEANFFESPLVETVERLAADGHRVVLAGTDQTFRGEPFHPLPELVAVAEYVDKLQAICANCGEPATRNQRFVDGEPAHVDDPTIVVGAEERYEARCRDCHTLRRD